VSEVRNVLVVSEPSIRPAVSIDDGRLTVDTGVSGSSHVIPCSDVRDAAERVATDGSTAAAVLVGRGAVGELRALERDSRVLADLPDGVAVVSAGGTILWGNARFREWCGCESVADRRIGDALNAPEIVGDEGDPVAAVVAGATAAAATVRTADNRYFHLRAAPFTDTTAPGAAAAVVSVREVTHTILEQQKRAAIHHAGQQLADLTPAELASMSVTERIDLLKSNILHYSRDLLQFDVIEIRLLDARTGRLEPLLAEGMEPEAEARVLFARTENNGVTGFVAATGRSYHCTDTTHDPHYLEGCKGAKTSLTVPLTYHDRVLVAEKATTAAASIEAIHGAVALPVDDILNEAVNVMERYIGHDADVVERLQKILRNARDIKLVIQKVGETMTPSSAHTQSRQPQRPRLVRRRILVVDADEQVRAAAHSHLERCGCIVETARDGGEAISMVRNARDSYDIVLSDIRLPDMTGYELLVRLLEGMSPGRFILMQEFGWDPGHSIVKARQAGSRLQLFKPFRVDQLLDTIERALAD